MTWLAGARIILGTPGSIWVGDGPTKLVLHTIEGSTIDGAVTAYRANGWPHISYDPAARDLAQHLPLTQTASALYNAAHIPGETNRAYRAIQVELVGFAEGTGEWTEELLRNLAEDIVLPIRAAVGLDPVALRCYGTGAGFILARPSSPIRILHGDAFARFGGICGHQHIGDDNDHWDPGALNVARLLALTGGGTLIDPLTGEHTLIPPDTLTPAEEADMPAAICIRSADGRLWLVHGCQKALVSDDVAHELVGLGIAKLADQVISLAALNALETVAGWSSFAQRDAAIALLRRLDPGALEAALRI